jgi:mono/diheme cytochrome c family protein
VHSSRLPGALCILLRSLCIGLAILPVASRVAGEAQPVGQTAQSARQDLIARGEYLSRAGDCIACHTLPAGKLFGGGRPMETPFGTLYSPNISSDKETGIGNWSADEFYTMLHEGKSRDGSLLYPAMPFASYTKVTRADSDAIYAYLQSVPQIHQPNRPHQLKFPFNQRQLLLGWRTLFFREGEYRPAPAQSAQWNRGAYLVEGLGHCTMCHTQINALGGNTPSKQFQGGLIPMQNWYAPSLTSNREAGLGDWGIDDIVGLLHAGVSNRGAVYGPMAEGRLRQLAVLERRRRARDGGVPEGTALAIGRIADGAAGRCPIGADDEPCAARPEDL